MENIFITLLNLSITASYIILSVLVLRLLLFKAPKWISCLLWSVVGLRLILPFSVESVLSLIPSAKPIPEDIMISQKPEINSGMHFVNDALNPIISESFKPNVTESANPLQTVFFIASIIWIIGVVLMLLWGVISYIIIRKKTVPSLKLDRNIYLCDNVASPFILGIIKPRIYMPSTISNDEAALVTEHERAHISRLDNIWKPLGFVVLSVYWFNPLVWLAYILLCRDIEKACDQKVIKSMDDDSRRNYSRTLLSYSDNSVRISACPLAFGEVGVKTRVKSILNYKKPAFWIIIVALLLLVATAVAFLTYPKTEPRGDAQGPVTPIYGETDTSKLTDTQRELMENYPEFFGLDCSQGLYVYVWQMSKGSYSYGLSNQNFSSSSYFSIDIERLAGVYPSSMRSILATYDIPLENITVIPCQKAISSYIGPGYLGKADDENYNQLVRKAYLFHVTQKLFDEKYDSITSSCEISIYDLDNDGNPEMYVMGKEPNSTATFIYLIYEPSSGTCKYYQ